MNNIRIYTLILTLIMSILSANFVYAAMGLPEGFMVLDECPFVICSELTDSTELELTDRQFNRMASSLIFRVNRTDMEMDQPFFDQLNDSVINWLKNEHFQIEKLFIRGAASPEGPYANNRRLGSGRAKKLFDYLEKKLSTPDSPAPRMESQTIIEDYRYLVQLMEAAGDAEADTVRSLMEACEWNEPRCKIALRGLNGGKTWNRLLAEYFPRLRSARVVIWVKRYTLPNETAIEIPNTGVDVAPVSAFDKAQNARDSLPMRDYIYHRRHVMAIRTNLVRDLFYMPKFGWAPTLDVQLEFFPLKGNYTANMGFSWSNWRKWDKQKFFQIRDFQISARRYFREQAQFDGWFVGLYLQGLVYGVGLNAKEGWQGEGWGIGFDGGYVLNLTKNGHLRMEFGLSIGYLGSLYDEYVYGNPVSNDVDGLYYYNFIGAAEDFHRRNTLLTWFGPTNLSISLAYDIAYYSRKRVLGKGKFDWNRITPGKN